MLPEKAALRGLRKLDTGWVAASDGYVIVAQRGDPADLLPYAYVVNPVEWFEPRTKSLGARPIDKLRGWAGPARWPEDQHGTFVYPPEDLVELADVKFDRARIAMVAEILPDDCTVTLYVQPHGKYHCLLGDAGEVKFIVMCWLPPEDE